MKRRFLGALLALVCLVGLGLPGLSAQAQPQAQGERFLVGIQGPAGERAVQQAGGRVLRQYKGLDLLLVNLPPGGADGLRRGGQVRYVERDQQVRSSHLTWDLHLTWDPNHLTWNPNHLTWNPNHLTWNPDHLTWDPDYLTWNPDDLAWLDGTTLATDWGLQATGAARAWERGNRGEGVRVAVIDSGIALDHPALQVAGGINLLNQAASYADDNGHGTHMAGIIAARGAWGLSGMAPEAELYAVKVLAADGSGYLSDVLAGLEWAMQQEMQVVNLSLGGHSTSRAIQETLIKARAKGILLVAAAGNSANLAGQGETLEVPARYDSVIAVGAIAPDLSRAPFSATGKGLDLMAPGVSILSAFPGGAAVGSGTSQAAAFVSGVVTLILAENPGASVDEVEAMLRSAALPLTTAVPSKAYGYGLVQVGPNR